MALSVYSKFYYGFRVTEFNCALDFIDSGGIHSAVLTPGTYTLAQFLIEIVRAVNVVGSQPYDITVDRSNRVITFKAESEFELLIQSGVNNHISAYELLGFTGSDLAGEIEYSGNAGSGKEYRPQIYLQSYKPTSSNRRAKDSVRKETVTGVVEAVTFGSLRMMECQIMYITSIPQPENFIIRHNDNGFEDAVEFLEYATSLAEVEFIEDESKPHEFEVLVLASTELDAEGMDFELIEEVDEKLPGYFRSGILKWNLRV